MNLQVRPYEPEDFHLWDQFSYECQQSTFQHTRRFLSYHQNRFVDQSLIIEKNSSIVGLFPAAESLEDDSCVISHPGATFGGIIHKGDLHGELMIHALQSVCAYYFENNYKKILYKAIPSIYHKSPSNDDIYALFRLNFSKYRCDLSSTIDLNNRMKVSERRRRGVQKALKNNVMIVEDDKYLHELWCVLQSNLLRKHQANPTHSFEQIKQLKFLFPKEISCVYGIAHGEVVAGVVIFTVNNCMHAQYICSSERGAKISALDLLFEFCIEKAKIMRMLWFDFGISTVDQGKTLNLGLYQFKREFGAGSITHDFYELNA